MRRSLAILLMLAMALMPCTVHAADPREDALALSKQALEAYLAGDFVRSATLYGQAYHTWPGEALYLYNAARSAERAGQLPDAERMYQEYLDRAPPSQPEVAKARFHLSEMKAARKPPPAQRTEPRPLPAPPKARPEEGSSRATAGTVLLVSGGVAVIVAGVVLAMAASDQSTLDGRLSVTDGQGHITGIGQSDANARQSSINSREYGGWALVGAGVVAGTVGAVLLATAPSARVSVTPWPDGHGAMLAGRF